MYPQTSFEPKYCAFNLKGKVSAHGLGLVVQLSWKVAPLILYCPGAVDLLAIVVCFTWLMTRNLYKARTGSKAKHRQTSIDITVSLFTKNQTDGHNTSDVNQQSSQIVALHPGSLRNIVCLPMYRNIWAFLDAESLMSFQTEQYWHISQTRKYRTKHPLTIEGVYLNQSD